MNLPDGAIAPLALDYRAGICALDQPKVFNDFTTGFALKVWTGDDWCPRHPLYDPNIVQGSDLQYRPGEGSTFGTGGFDRLPTFQEAVAMAMKDSQNRPIIAQEKVKERVEDKDHGRSR